MASAHPRPAGTSRGSGPHIYARISTEPV
jgi:hypothetical protein